MCSRAADAMREHSVAPGKSFLDIPRPYRHSTGRAQRRFWNQFLAIASVIIVKNIFESIRDSKVGRAARAERKPR